MTDKSIFCALAFGSASINAYGDYIPCCNIHIDKWYLRLGHGNETELAKLDPKDRINEPDLKKVRQKLINGEWPQACYKCKDAESLGAPSTRTIWNKGLQEFDIPMVEHVDPNNIRFLDLTISTKCNSKCMTCGPDLSDFWEQEYWQTWKVKESQRLIRNRDCISIDDAKRLTRDFPNIRRIAFVGGEPTIADNHHAYLKLLVENGHSKEISLSYVTNLTGLSNELIALWKNFKSVHISVSVDAYGKVNEYIRYPFKWEKIEANMRKISMLRKESTDVQITLGLSCTVSLFNAIQCFDLLEFWLDLGIEYGTPTGDNVYFPGTFINRVFYPYYCIMELLPIEYRLQGLEKGQRILDKIKYYKEQGNENITDDFEYSIKQVMSWLEVPQRIDDHSKRWLTQLRHFIASSDIYRKRSIKDYIPELHEELEKLYIDQKTSRTFDVMSIPVGT